VIKPWAYEGEIKFRIDPVHQTELLEHFAVAGIRSTIGHEFHEGAWPVIIASGWRRIRTLELNDVDEDFGSTSVGAVDQEAHAEAEPIRVRVADLIDHSGR
jgi:hypothetical protein